MEVTDQLQGHPLHRIELKSITGIVEFSCLANAKASTTYDQNFRDIDEVSCSGDNTRLNEGLGVRSLLRGISEHMIA